MGICQDEAVCENLGSDVATFPALVVFLLTTHSKVLLQVVRWEVWRGALGTWTRVNYVLASFFCLLSLSPRSDVSAAATAHFLSPYWAKIRRREAVNTRKGDGSLFTNKLVASFCKRVINSLHSTGPYLSILKPEQFVNMVNLNLSSGLGSSRVVGTHQRETNVSEY